MSGTPIKVTSPDGWTFEVRSIQEASDLKRQFQSPETEKPQEVEVEPPGVVAAVNKDKALSPPVVSSNQSSNGKFERFTQQLNTPKRRQEHRIIAIVAGHGDEGVELSDVMRALGIDTATLGARSGVIGKLCKQLGIDKDDILVRSGDHFFPGRMLREHRDELPPVPEK